MPRSFFLPLSALTLATVVVSQSGRTMRLHVPAVIGHTALVAMQHPVAAAGNLYAIVWSSPFAGAMPLAVPGLTVNGLVRIDLSNAILTVSGVLDSSGTTANFPVSIPNDPLLVGYAWDMHRVVLAPIQTL